MRKVIVTLLISVFSLFVFSVTQASAKVISNQNGPVTVVKTEIINDDLVIGAETVQIDGIVNGDVYAGGQTVKITGAINGNLHIGAGSVDLEATVKGNTYIGGGEVRIVKSKLGGSLIVGSGSVNIDQYSTIAGSVFAGTGQTVINSIVKRNVFVGSGSVDINSVIGGEVRIGAGRFTLGDKTKIAKDLYYAADNSQGQVKISPSAVIAGAIHKSDYQITNQKDIEAAQKQIPGILDAAKIGTTLISLIGALIIGLLYFKLFGKHFSQTVGKVSGEFWKSMGIGFLVTIAFVPALIILLITIVGIPLAGIVILMLLLYFYLAKIVVGSALGDWFVKTFNWKISTYWTFALGLLAIYILKMIPVVGFVVGMVVFFVGLGALTIQMFSKSE